ncbi:hypothetical protein Rifp1Sym_bd00050 [endosymbiont of Riftia pachyptila (vent Ph05)]|uniref:Uncharacterized protein n=1 Tax=endosymbiont of Riftia pachyptila (vent Ph05) TaxID=1048808 RepID=G2DCL9_9GAMM|nr:hypothetical protein Rifp1Sym_bd00050 [endosymbiont of Riftia pachyptila (vent Ph05)]
MSYFTDVTIDELSVRTQHHTAQHRQPAGGCPHCIRHRPIQLSASTWGPTGAVYRPQRSCPGRPDAARLKAGSRTERRSLLRPQSGGSGTACIATRHRPVDDQEAQDYLKQFDAQSLHVRDGERIIELLPASELNETRLAGSLGMRLRNLQRQLKHVGCPATHRIGQPHHS